MALQPLEGLGVLIIEDSRSRLYTHVYTHTHTHTHTTVGLLWTSDRPVAETSTWQHNTHKRQTSMPPVVFEPAMPASQRPHTQALDRAATGIGKSKLRHRLKFLTSIQSSSSSRGSGGGGGGVDGSSGSSGSGSSSSSSSSRYSSLAD
jgi:uncharacterized membrane protein YgcG